MKQIVLTGMIAFLAIAGFAQKSNVTNAAMAYSSYMENMAADPATAKKDLLEAKSYIDLACVHTETIADPKAWMYKGKIYIDLSAMVMAATDKADFAGMQADKMLEDGFAAFAKSKEVDAKKRYEEDINAYAEMYRAILSNAGITAYGEDKFELAMGGLLGAAKFGEVIGLKDSMMYFFGGIAAYNSKQFEVAEEAFKNCVELNYNLGESMGYLAKSMKELGKTAEAEKLLKETAAKYPNNLDVLIQLINFYIDNNRNQEAGDAISAAIKLDPNNIALVYNSGIIYETLGKMDVAEAAYLKSLELKPDYTDALYSLGVFYYNRGADASNIANDLPYGDPAYDKTIAESKEFWGKALPYLEKAHLAEPSDLVILESLKLVYGKLGMTEKFVQTKNKIEAIKNGVTINGQLIKIGMSENEVVNLLGPAQDVNETIVEGLRSKQMVYPNNVYIYVDNGKVVTIQK
jgi:tetratricopeptide (TPR) repeat protein